jgi:MoxR-like ATPase
MIKAKLRTTLTAPQSRALRFCSGFGSRRLERLNAGETVALGIGFTGLPEGVTETEIELIVRDAKPAPQPEPQPDTEEQKPMTASNNKLELLEQLLSGSLDEARVIDLIKTHATGPATVKVDVRVPDREIKFEGAVHVQFPKLLSAVSQRLNVMLVGPAGSGKTTAAQKVAEALGLPFYFTGAINSEYKLTGFIDAQGRIVNTAFRKAFIEGGVFLFDEMDGSLPAATLAFNAATANRVFDFPEGMHEAHPDFIAVAAANTYGTGASRQYVGRNQLDAATLDRYAMLEWGYDEALEAAIMGLPRPGGAPVPKSLEPVSADRASELVADWVRRVQSVRRAIDKLKIRHVVSPRASQAGAKLLAAGWDWTDVEACVIWKGLERDTVIKILEAV